MASKASVQQALRQFLPDPEKMDVQRQRVCRHLLQCRTAAMGGQQLRCDACRHEEVQYFSCRDRHCPQCQWRVIQQWAERQRVDVLPVPYHHVVFTLPHQLNGWVQLHPELIYRLLFQSVWGTLDHFGRDPKRLNGQLGMTAVLHTWGQTLNQHVHLHCLVPAGAFGQDGSWHAARSNYLFPVRALSRRYRGLMVSALRQAASQQQLHRVTRAGEVDQLLDSLMATEWVVYSKHCLQHTSSVIDYLARYTRRIAISNARLQSVDEHSVTLDYKDYRQGTQPKQMTLSGEEFVRRFLLHILPKGLMRVRHYGFLANRCRRTRLERIRRALRIYDVGRTEAMAAATLGTQRFECRQCKRPSMRCVGIIAPRVGRVKGRLRRG
ncbi:MAG: IS91 family transposase [Pseudomonas sp.]